jgi:hypothetical protein
MCAVILSAQIPLKAMEISGFNAIAQLDYEEPIKRENIQDKSKISSSMVQTKSSHWGQSVLTKVKVLIDGWYKLNMTASQANS